MNERILIGKNERIKYLKIIAELKQRQTQTAIECLKEVKESFRSEGYFDEFDDYVVLLDNIDRVIDNKIKELEDDK